MSYNVTPSYYSPYVYPQVSPTMPVGYNIPTVQAVPQQPSVPTPSIPSPTASSNIQWVQGESAALAFPVAPGNTMILMDSENPVVYKKSTDEHGKPLPMDIYDLIKRERRDPASVSAPSVDMKDYMKKDEVKTFIAEQIEKEVDKRVSQLSFKPATKKKRPDEYEEE